MRGLAGGLGRSPVRSFSCEIPCGALSREDPILNCPVRERTRYDSLMAGVWGSDRLLRDGKGRGRFRVWESVTVLREGAESWVWIAWCRIGCGFASRFTFVV